jgi:predicted nucleic acid-binding protein
VIVIDASALLEVLLRTPAAKVVEDRLFAPRQTLHAPDLLDVEVAQVIRRYAANGEIDSGRGRMALTDLADLSLRCYPHDFLLPRIWELRNNLTAHDAAYVALAEALDTALLTRDRRLAAPRAITRRSNWYNSIGRRSYAANTSDRRISPDNRAGRIVCRWRKGWDSNPRYPCRHAGFQDRCLKPLGHPSVVAPSTI